MISLNEYFDKIEYDIEINKTDYTIFFNGRIKKGILLDLLGALKGKIAGFSSSAFFKSEKIVLPKSGLSLLLPKINPIIDDVVNQVRKDSGKPWATINRKISSCVLEKQKGTDFYLIEIVVFGDCPDC